MTGVSKILCKMQTHLTYLDSYFDGIQNDLDLEHLEFYKENFTKIIEIKISELLYSLCAVTEGIYNALGKKLSPRTMELVPCV